MAILPLCYLGNPILKKKARNLEEVHSLDQFLADMFETMYHHSGVGLAASQVGSPHNLFVMNASYDKDDHASGSPEIFINPCITRTYGKEVEDDEGCLSVPELREKVKRKEFIDVEYLDIKGAKQVEKGVSGFRARVIQHETDHLMGMLFVDRLSPAKKLILRAELRRIQKDYN